MSVGCTRGDSNNSVEVSTLSGRSSSTSVRMRKLAKQGTTSLRVSWGRILFVLSLCVIAGVLSYIAAHLIKVSEERLAEEHYDAIAEKALAEAFEITLRKRLGAISLATTVAQMFPDPATWPNVSMRGFEDIALSVMAVSGASGFTMGLCPLVTPDQYAGFEDFVYNNAFTKINPHYPNTTGMDDWNGDGNLQEGIESFTESFVKYRDTNGTTEWGSPYQVACPFVMHSVGPPILMFNLHSLERFGRTVDEVITCANNREWVQAGNLHNDSIMPPFQEAIRECSVLGDIVIAYGSNQSNPVVSAFMYQPVYPARNVSVLTGIVTHSMAWKDVFDELFTVEVNGVDIVLKTETKAYTYRIQNGIATDKGEGDLHDDKYRKYQRDIHLLDTELFAYTSAHYHVSLYPSDALFEAYSTSNPRIAAIGAACIVLITAVLFFLYDFCVQQEFNHNAALMEAKRRFVRFISHEVRTPLNTISMGAQLLQEELSGFATAPQARRDVGLSSSQSTAITAVSHVSHFTRTTSDFIPDGGSHSSDHSNDYHLHAELQEKLTDWADLVRDVLQNANSAVDVLSDLLNYDKVETGTLNLEISVIPIWSLIKRTASEFKLGAAAKNVQYVVDFSPLLPEASTASNDDIEKPNSTKFCSAYDLLPPEVREQQVVGDAIRITQVFRNFLSNAIKFTPEEGRIDVRVSWKKDNVSDERKHFVLDRGEKVSLMQSGYVEVDVKDSGAGLSHEEVQKVFGEGVQFNVNKLQAGQGSGLGLYIAKGIAEQHGGSLKVASEGLGCGTTFTMVLPLCHAPDSALPPELISRRQALDKEANAQSSDDPDVFHVLVVDDTHINRKMLMRLLKGKGHICEQAENGKEAVEMVQKAMKEGKIYDTVLLDYEMPVMKGPAAAAKMREIGCDAFIVGITGNLMPEDVQHFKEHGANCVLGKPLSLRDLQEKWVEYGVSSSGDH